MIIFRTDKTLLLIAIGICIFFGSISIYKDEKESIERRESLSIPNPPESEWSKVRGYNFEQGGFHYRSDNDIRRIREELSFDTEGRYLYTPGRRVRSLEQMVEEYVEDNIEDLLDGYLD